MAVVETFQVNKFGCFPARKCTIDNEQTCLGLLPSLVRTTQWFWVSSMVSCNANSKFESHGISVVSASCILVLQRNWYYCTWSNNFRWEFYPGISSKKVFICVIFRTQERIGAPYWDINTMMFIIQDRLCHELTTLEPTIQTIPEYLVLDSVPIAVYDFATRKFTIRLTYSSFLGFIHVLSDRLYLFFSHTCSTIYCCLLVCCSLFTVLFIQLSPIKPSITPSEGN